MKILFLTRLNEYFRSCIPGLREQFPEVEFLAGFSENKDENLKNQWLKEADAIVAGRITEEQVEQAQSLKILFIPFTGTNAFPLQLLKKKGVTISNTHGNAAETAERGIALTLALLGRIVFFHNELQQGRWHRSHNADDLWESLYHKKCGIMGAGHIGRKIAGHLRPFNCEVIGLKRTMPEKLPENFDAITTHAEELIDRSEVIFVSLPLTSSTKGMINATLLDKMQDKYLINIGRGELIEEEALYDALSNGTLAGAALDVWYQYPKKGEGEVYPSQYPFHELHNLVMSPHKASHTSSAVKGNVDAAIENIKSWIQNGRPRNLVDPDEAY